MNSLIRNRRTFRPGLETLEDRLPVTTILLLGAPAMTAWPEALTPEETPIEMAVSRAKGVKKITDNSPSPDLVQSEARLHIGLDEPFQQTRPLNPVSATTTPQLAARSQAGTPNGSSSLLPALSNLPEIASANTVRIDARQYPAPGPTAAAMPGGGGGGAGGGGGGGGASGGAPTSAANSISGSLTGAASFGPTSFDGVAATGSTPTTAIHAAEAPAASGVAPQHIVPEDNSGSPPVDEDGGGKGGDTSNDKGGGKSTITPNYEYYVKGKAADKPISALPATSSGLALAGGGVDVDAVFTWMAARANGGDFLVIRATGTDAYDPYINKLAPDLDSVATLIVKNQAGANDPFVVQKVNEAEAVFFAGGDQADYIKFYKGTSLEDAINNVVENKHVPIGGTSAGLAVLGDFDYAALQGSITSPEALANPYDSRVTISKGFITPNEAPTSALKYLNNVITDSHFLQRDRMGREMTFLARVDADYLAANKLPRGIAINEETALLIDSTGQATVVGNSLGKKEDPVANARSVYFLQGAAVAPNVLSAPLTYTVNVARADAGVSVNLASTWPAAAWQNIVTAGVLTSTKPGGLIY